MALSLHGNLAESGVTSVARLAHPIGVSRRDRRMQAAPFPCVGRQEAMPTDHLSSALPEKYAATTVGLSGSDKFDYWHAVVRRNVVDLDCRLANGNGFDASIEGMLLPGLNVWRIDASPHSAVRNTLGIARSGSESLVLNFVMSGRLHAEQDGRHVVLSTGDGALCDAQRPYVLDLPEPVSIACVKLPRGALSPRLVGLQRATAIGFESASTLCPLVFGYLVNLTERGSRLTALASDKAARNFTELLAAMIDEVVATSPLPLSEYRVVALMRVKEFVERHLSDSDFDPAMVATALKLSPRYINQLLEAEGTSLSRHIWRRRLERTAADLGNPALSSRSISVIAMSHGFNDLSHFSKAFRQAFGRSPREFRACPSDKVA